MLRHCPIPRFSSVTNSKKKMPKSLPKEKAPQAPPGSLALELLDPKEVSREPSQKVLKIFSINIITQGLPFCRRRFSSCSKCKFLLQSALFLSSKTQAQPSLQSDYGFCAFIQTFPCCWLALTDKVLLKGASSQAPMNVLTNFRDSSWLY
ncbi:F-box/WD repeat-containing protein 7 isoform X2 [Tachysurus ichikawai]